MALHIYALGGGSHILVSLFGIKVGECELYHVISELLGERFMYKKLLWTNFIQYPKIVSLDREDQVRRWIFVCQLMSLAKKIDQVYGELRTVTVRWNRNKTLVSTANSMAPGGTLYFDFGGGQIKCIGHAENHSAKSLLEELESGDQGRIDDAIENLRSLVSKLMSYTASEGVIGFKFICLCTGSYWKQIVENHLDKFSGCGFELQWIDEEQERYYEFTGLDEAYGLCTPPSRFLTRYAGCFTSGGSSSSIWFSNAEANRGLGMVEKYPLAHGSKSDLFSEQNIHQVDSAEKMHQLFMDQGQDLEDPEPDLLESDEDDTFRRF